MKVKTKGPAVVGPKGQKPKFQPNEPLEVKKNSKVFDKTDHNNRPFEGGAVLNEDVTGASGKQIGEPYWDEKAEDFRYPIKLDDNGGVISVPENRLRNKFGRSRKSFGFSRRFSQNFDRIFEK